jgi:hypothetical protein
MMCVSVITNATSEGEPFSSLDSNKVEALFLVEVAEDPL